MTEVRLPYKVGGKDLSSFLEKAVKKSLVPLGYHMNSFYNTESYYPTDSSRLHTVKTSKVIEVTKPLKNANETLWGHTVLYPSDEKNFWGLKLGIKPSIALSGTYDSFNLMVTEQHVSRNSERFVFIEPEDKQYGEYKKDVKSLLDELKVQLLDAQIA